MKHFALFFLRELKEKVEKLKSNTFFCILAIKDLLLKFIYARKTYPCGLFLKCHIFPSILAIRDSMVHVCKGKSTFEDFFLKGIFVHVF